MRKTLEFKWSVSRARDTCGYNICTLWVDGTRVASCNGGGYDMEGTVLGEYIAGAFADKLLTLTESFYGLTFHDPTYDPGKEIIEGETVEQREKELKSIDLERYQATYSAATKLPDTRHTVPQIDGATGFASVERILKAIGYQLSRIRTRGANIQIYLLEESHESNHD